MIKMSSKKRKRTENTLDIRTYFDKENVAPGNVHSPPKKKTKGAPGFQTQTSTPLGARDTNAGSSLVKPQHHQLPSINPRVQWGARTTAEDGLKQVQEASLATEKEQWEWVFVENRDWMRIKTHNVSVSCCSLSVSSPAHRLFSEHCADSSRTLASCPPPGATPGRLWSS
ncbi:uncharacterized protein LOC105923481 [Fundulus heteroclitus]|uniref:uncharacterized protein LOC105923481 n=1 Tax=Fundulus heteroclitus TaxID=8078 RepID=UPI00165BFC35|nr:uncharacterized protein LOC105923481 [Fundulus heteroclitus]